MDESVTEEQMLEVEKKITETFPGMLLLANGFESYFTIKVWAGCIFFLSHFIIYYESIYNDQS